MGLKNLIQIQETMACLVKFEGYEDSFFCCCGGDVHHEFTPHGYNVNI